MLVPCSIFNRAVALISFLYVLSTLSTCNAAIQNAAIRQTDEAQARAATIKDAFLVAYNDYIRYGYPADEVLPVSKGGRNSRNGCLIAKRVRIFLSPMKDAFDDAVNKTLKIDFSTNHTDDLVVVFETTIRYVGGILSAYELSGANNQALLDQARVLTDKLIYAWPDENQKLPYSVLSFTDNTPASDIVSLAAAGSMIVEFDRLSYYTKNDKYRNLADKSMKFLMDLPGIFPGLPGLRYSAKNGSVIQDRVTWGASADSYYEYLLKYPMLTNQADPVYLESWKKAVGSSIKYLVTTSSLQNLTYLDEYSESEGGKRHMFSHLACFAVLAHITQYLWRICDSPGGNWMMGGRVLNDPEILRYGILLLETCMRSYTATKTGLGPEIFNFLPPDGSDGQRGNSEFYKANGFYITNSQYMLRPEVIESAFYAWRITGETKYQDFVWNAFQALQNTCKAPASYSAIDNVNSPNPKLKDDCESFLTYISPLHLPTCCPWINMSSYVSMQNIPQAEKLVEQKTKIQHRYARQQDA
ncbi:family 47 glycoside hydrolase [Melampsora larici-populina 98AG31]|uniref:alpha-1,2-Mannosidase n=1 Tax=Melampsora larici-populina (strain 98AG31 / pathotype 3-4-7) TaxID=747676 RepID=F4RZT7_MELLP|nr:family 47 glycoside hydrolase [Melampsora larici-populina 98AG31]EGG02131.1 family 47 glycoside hydrolase [Melampsora larici-populina 98AG31]